MTIAYLKSLFDSEGDVVEFQGRCHDCGKETAVVCIRDGEDLHITGGAYWRQIEKDFIKCDECFDRQPKLTNFMPCEVYSRVTGYLRPVQQWNAGKKEEFKARKMFDITKAEPAEEVG